VNKSKGHWHCDTIGLSQDGRDIVRLANTYGKVGENKSGLYFLARQHCGETPGSWVLDGALEQFSRARHPRLEEVSLEGLVDKTARQVKNELRLNHIKFSKEVHEHIPDIYVDKSGVQQVLLNLLINSIQAIHGGGRIKVALGLDHINDEVRIDVEDTGEGIPPELLDAVFDPFFSTKKEGEGTGLGLSVSYNIIRKQGGRIGVESRPGQGTCFSIFLPLGQEHEKTA
jgi:two-component system NtrC family sensor kinase